MSAPTGTPITPNPRSRRPVRADDGRLLRGRESRARIREAALALFREHGFDGATLRAIGARAGMGASSIYRHVRSKEELLVEELADRQEDAWTSFRSSDDRRQSARERMAGFLRAEHALLAEDADLTIVALRAMSHPERRVARRVLALQDRTIGLLTELLMSGRVRGEIARDVDVVAAARALLHLTQGARISWANGLLTAEECGRSIEAAVGLLFRGLAPAAAPAAPKTPTPG
jgi:AcrR family transcriptional regulator